ncbi:hypothetical protein [Variovorax gossypii]
MTTQNINALLRRYADGPETENAFWRGVVANFSQAGPIWGLDLNSNRAPLSVDSFIYLVDTANMWLASAAISPEQLAVLLEERGTGQGGGSPERERAAQALAAASVNGLATATPETLSAFGAALTAVAMSPAYGATMAQVPQASLPSFHHWIVLLYRLTGGELVAGLGHIDEPYAGMMERNALLDCVDTMVQMDLGNVRTIVNQAVKRAGGLQLAPDLRHITIA